MYSIVEIKGKQYKVEPDSTVLVDRIEQQKETSFDDIKVLLHKADDGSIQIGTPYLENVKIEATVAEEERGAKVVAVRYKPKSGYIKRHGHRQKYTQLKIASISAT